ncbi:hypothetical protein H4S06_005629, partial [Coemansia sp. BCRC 34490]
TIQDGQGAPYFLDKICVRFTSDFAIEKQVQLEAPEISGLIEKSIAGHRAEAEGLPFVDEETGAIDREAIGAGDIGGWAPWYTAFRHDWVDATRASEHEAFQHPVACVLAVSGSEPDPVGSLRELQRHAVVGRVQAASFTGPSLLFYYVLVHDERDTAILQTVDATFDQVRRTFGQNCTLLRVNSNTDLLGTDSSDRDRVSGVWSGYYDHHRHRRPGAQPLDAVPADRAFGTMMTMRDVTALRDA